MRKQEMKLMLKKTRTPLQPYRQNPKTELQYLPTCSGNNEILAYLSPARSIGRVHLKRGQSGTDHGQPVNVDDVVCLMTMVTKNAGKYPNTNHVNSKER